MKHKHLMYSTYFHCVAPHEMNDTWKTAGMLAESFGGKGKVEGRKNNVRKRCCKRKILKGE
jgi:hypothetical protein